MTATEIQDYSQNGEQSFILECTPTHGRFLDIGAWHPTELSNTRALYERGCSGVLVEPSPVPVRDLIEAYGNCDHIDIVAAAIGTELGLMRLHVSDGAYTTGHADALEKFRDIGQYIGCFHVPVVTLEALINQFGAFDFVNIDIEGGSVDLFRHLLTIPMNPACICVEHDQRIVEAVQAAQNAGYRLAHGNGTNLVFAKIQ